MSGGSAASSTAPGSPPKKPDAFSNGAPSAMPFAAPGSVDAFGAQAGVYQKLDVGGGVQNLRKMKE